MNKRQLHKASISLHNVKDGLPTLLNALIMAIEDGDAGRIYAKLEALQARRNELTEALEILIVETKQSKTPG